MTAAARDVLLADRRILDIAVEYAFASHEGFTRAFHRAFGVTPSEARVRGHVLSTSCRRPVCLGCPRSICHVCMTSPTRCGPSW